MRSHSPHRSARRLTLAGVALALGVSVLAVAPAAPAGATSTATADPGPSKALAKLTRPARAALADGDRDDFWVRFASDDQAVLDGVDAITDRSARGREVVDRLRARARASQRDVRAELDAAGADYSSYWVTDAVLVRHGDLDLAVRLAQQTEVTQIRPTASWTQEVPPPSSTSGWQDTGVVPWGIQAVHADDVWADGVDGTGITVANLDTGVDVTHPALRGRYRGLRADGTLDDDYNFYDVAGVCPTADPCDANGHGTHTMGTMLGSAPGHQVGVAPGARWIAVNGCAGPECSDANLVRSAQWLLAPTRADGTGADPDRRPDIVNNSWGGEPGSANNPFFDDILDAWNASGIFSSWSIGNSGPACGTAAAPGGRTSAYSVGAYGHTGDLAFFSSRGPGQDGRAKPDITAPGMGVVSSWPGGGYQSDDGTSMAAPHVAGAVALLWSARPELVGDLATTRSLLDKTAHDVDDTTCGGTAADNPSWGEGSLDAAALVAAAPTTFGTLTGTVTAADGTPVPRAVVAADGDLDRTGHADPDGAFTLPLRPGTYQVTFSGFGFLPTTRTVVVPADGGSVAVGRVELDPAPHHVVSGTLRQTGGGPLIDTVVRLGDDVAPARTGLDGSFTFPDVPEGTYTLTVAASVCGATTSTKVVVDGDETVAVTQDPPVADVGFVGCRGIVGGFRSGTDEHRFANQTTPLTLDLPFAFPWFGKLTHTAVISPDGWLRLDPPQPDPRDTYPADNLPLPDFRLTAALIPFFDALRTTAVYTSTTTVDGEPAYVVEWRDATLDPVAHPAADPAHTLDFSVTLTASGDAVIGWGDGVGDDPLSSGSSATVGFQSALGSDGRLTPYAWGTGQAVAAAGRGVVMDARPTGFLHVAVTDAGDDLPTAGARVSVTGAGPTGDTDVSLTTDRTGAASVQLPLGDYTVTTEARGYDAETSTVSLSTPGQVLESDATLATSRASVTGGGRVTLQGDATGTTQVTVANSGTTPMSVSLAETGADAEAAATAPVVADPAGAPTRGATSAPAVRRAPHVLSRFRTVYDNNSGVATDGASVWTNELYGMQVARYTPSGSLRGQITAPYDRSSPLITSGDLAYDSRTGELCEAIHGDTGGEIRCYSPADGSVRRVLHGSWEMMNPTGLAYNAQDDVFYLGGGFVFTIAGTTHAQPGALLHSCLAPDPDLRGLAYNASSRQVWTSLEHQDYAGARAPREDRLVALSPTDCALSGRADLPEGMGSIGGLDIDPAGRLWVVDRSSSAVLLVDVDDVVTRDVRWLGVPTGTTTVPAGESRTFTIRVDGSRAATGSHTADVVVRTSSGRASTTLVPITLDRRAPAAYAVAVDVGAGRASTDARGHRWSADRPYRAGGWGHLGHSRALSTRRPIAGTTLDRLFQTARVATGRRLGYRFDAPAGTYAIDLGFAGIDRLHRRQRVFDVVVDGRTVLRRLDPAARGARRALVRALRVRHRGGPLTVTLVQRRGPGRPLLSYLRVTEQLPD